MAKKQVAEYQSCPHFRECTGSNGQGKYRACGYMIDHAVAQCRRARGYGYTEEEHEDAETE